MHSITCIHGNPTGFYYYHTHCLASTPISGAYHTLTPTDYYGDAWCPICDGLIAEPCPVERDTLKENRDLNVLKNRIRQVQVYVDTLRVVYPPSLERAQVDHALGTLLTELAYKGIHPRKD